MFIPITYPIYAVTNKLFKLKGFVTNIEKDTVKNENFRKVLYTGKNSQLVLMTLKPGEEIGEEVHKDTDQFFRVDSGKGKVVINGKSHDIDDGFAIIIPQGAKHNVINTGKKPLKVYTIYSPPHHRDGVIHKTKEDALSDKEHFDGKTTEYHFKSAMEDKNGKYVWEKIKSDPEIKTLKYVSPFTGKKFHVSPST